LDNLIHGLSIALQAQNLFYCFIGCLAGTLIGVLPGIGPPGAVALLLPATYHLNPISAIIMMCGIAYGAMYGGSTTSILVNVPGEAASVVTCLDGHEMAKKGRGGPALGIAALGSFIAGTIGVVGLMFLALTLSRAALVFAPPEYFALMMMSLVVVTYLVRGSMIKALIMVGMGLVLGTVGMDALSGRERFTYGLPTLRDGIGIIPVVVGLFGVNEVIETLSAQVKMEVVGGRIKGYLPTLRDWKDSAGAIVRGTLLGFFMGILPGMSPMIPTFLSYGVEKRLSKHPEKFGTGVIEGVAGPESCNNAAAVGSFVPLLSLGIPSNAFNAVLLGALMIYGLQPGPLLIKTNPDLFWGVVASMYIGNVMLVVLNLPLVGMWVKLLDVPVYLLMLFIVLFSFLGVYTMNNSVQDLNLMVLFGVIGYLMKRVDIPATPIILGMVLGKLMEEKMRQSLVISDGSMMIFLNRPISLCLLILAVVAITNPYWKPMGRAIRRMFGGTA
jgi:putative tricarboxylic transport membrane protein